MKNLKLFVFSLCLMLVAVLSVNAANECNLPGENWTEAHGKACEASLNGEGYLHYGDAWTEFKNLGGDLVFYTNANFTTPTIKHSGSIEFKDNAKASMSGVFTIDKGVSLTIKNTDLTVTSGNFVVNGTLVLDEVKATTSAMLINNAGTTTINGGEYKATMSNTHVISNAANATLSLNNAKFTVSTGTLVYNFGTATLTGLTVDGKTATLVNTGAHGSTTTINSGSYLLNHMLSSNITSVPGFQANAAVVNVNGGTFETTANALTVDNGIVLNINDGTVTSAGQVVNMKNAKVTIANGTLTSEGLTVGAYPASAGSLTISGGTLVSKTSHPLYFNNNKATYAISGGTFESEVKDNYAIEIYNLGVTTKDGKTTIADAYTGILTGGKYLNNIIANVYGDDRGATVKVINQLVAEGYEVKDVTEGKKNYKVVVKTGATDVEPEKQPDATKPGSTGSEELPPDTYDAGLTYMGLAVLAVGASVVSVRKLRNN